MAANDTIKDLAPKMPTKYLRNFFAEKDIPARIFEKKGSDGTPHMIPNEVVVEMMTAMGVREARGVENVLRQIDFRNGDVNHFLEHLSGAVVDRFEASA